MPRQSAITKKTLVTDELIRRIEKAHIDFIDDPDFLTDAFESAYNRLVNIEEVDKKELPFDETLTELLDNYYFEFKVTAIKKED